MPSSDCCNNKKIVHTASDNLGIEKSHPCGFVSDKFHRFIYFTNVICRFILQVYANLWGFFVFFSAFLVSVVGLIHLFILYIHNFIVTFNKQ